MYLTHRLRDGFFLLMQPSHLIGKTMSTAATTGTVNRVLASLDLRGGKGLIGDDVLVQQNADEEDHDQRLGLDQSANDGSSAFSHLRISDQHRDQEHVSGVHGAPRIRGMQFVYCTRLKTE